MPVPMPFPCASCGLARAYPLFFFFNDTATTEIYTLSLHDALPILGSQQYPLLLKALADAGLKEADITLFKTRSEEHTSELQSPCNLVCRLLLEKKKKTTTNHRTPRTARPRTRAPDHAPTLPPASHC